MTIPALTYSAERLLRIVDVVSITGLSRPTIYRRMKDDQNPFPQPHTVTTMCVRWKASEVAAWIDRIPARAPP